MESEEQTSINIDVDQDILAQRLRDAREYLGFSQEHVADKLDIPRPAISSIENGKRKVSGIELKRFAQLYKRPVGFFLGTEDTGNSQDELLNALHRATRPLSQADREQVLQFAAFLKSAGKPPVPKEEEDEE